MQSAVIIRGRQVSPTQIELAEPLPDGVTSIDVIAHRAAALTVDESISKDPLMDFIRSLPPGSRTKADIDARVREERQTRDEQK